MCLARLDTNTNTTSSTNSNSNSNTNASRLVYLARLLLCIQAGHSVHCTLPSPAKQLPSDSSNPSTNTNTNKFQVQRQQQKLETRSKSHKRPLQMFLKSLHAYFWVFSSREATSRVPLTDTSDANILPSNEKDNLLSRNHLLRKLFALIHTMSHSEMIFQYRTSLIILATLGTREKQRFRMSALYVPGQTAPVEIFLTVRTFHFATCNSILRGGTSAGFHELFFGAPSYCRSS